MRPFDATGQRRTPRSSGRAVPVASVLTPVHDPPVPALVECLESVRAQSVGPVEHVVVDDCSTSPAVRSVLDDSARHGHIRLVRLTNNLGIVGASNVALQAATAEVVALLDHDDRLHPRAVELVTSPFADPAVDYVYSDEDVIGPDGRRVDPFYKPDWSPERLRNQMYTCHLSAFRRSVVEEVGGFREGFDGSQDWDLVLRVTERGGEVVHVPEVLYHWRVVPTSVLAGDHVKPYAYEAARRALEDHVVRTGIDADVVEQDRRGYFHLRRRHRAHPLVSIVIPTKGSHGTVWGIDRIMVVEAVRSIIERSTWPALEFVIVFDQATPAEVVEEVEELAGGRMVPVWWDRPFDFAEISNLGASVARGEYLVFLNDDVEVIDGDWIEVLVGFVREPDVGAAGLRLLFEDGRVQHAGHVLLGGSPGHLMFGQSPDSDKNRLALSIDRETSGVTAACLAIRRSVFAEVGGFSPLFPNNYNDVDLCLKLRSVGYRNIVSAQASLHHFESTSRDPTVAPAELQRLRGRWLVELGADPYYNPSYGSSFDNFPSPLRYP